MLRGPPALAAAVRRVHVEVGLRRRGHGGLARGQGGGEDAAGAGADTAAAGAAGRTPGEAAGLYPRDHDEAISDTRAGWETAFTHAVMIYCRQRHYSRRSTGDEQSMHYSNCGLLA